MPKKKLQNQIANKIEKLHKLLDQMDEVRIIQEDDPDTWDSDLLYNLTADLKEALQLLENKKHPREKDPWGEPLILEEGLCSLVDQYQEGEETYD